MKLEQRPPNKVNFGGVVLASAVAILVVFIVAIIYLHMRGSKVIQQPYRKNHTSRLAPAPLTPPSTIEVEASLARHLPGFDL